MSLTRYKPGGIAPPFSKYSHGVEAPADARWLFASGQVGVRPDGTLASGFEGQTVQALSNLHAILAEAGMDWSDVVLLKTFLTRQEDVPQYRVVREKTLGSAAPASTLLVVAGLASPDWLIEIEVVAATAP